MRIFIVCFFVALLFGSLAASQDLHSKWEDFKATHDKQHPSHEEAERMQRFAERDAEIEAHNARFAAGLESFSLQHTIYSDLSDEELDKHAFGFTPDLSEKPIPWNDPDVLRRKPSSFDWRDRNIMTPVKNQKFCGACYAFASLGVLEAYVKLQTNEEYRFSEQDIIDCTYKRYKQNTANSGCAGGSPSVVFQYLNESDVVLDSTYPYTSGDSRTQGTCKASRTPTNLINRRLTYSRVKVDNEGRLASLLLTKGPLVIAMGYDQKYRNKLLSLKNGIFDVPGGSNVKTSHLVVLVGYGKQNGKLYWIIRNSWGSRWSDGGYGKIARGKNMGNILGSGAWFISFI